MTICLYCAITPAWDFKPLNRGLLSRSKAASIIAADRLQWYVRKSTSFHFDAWISQEYTNRGDIATREAVKDLLKQQFGPDVDFLFVRWGELSRDVIREVNRTCSLFVICGGGYVFLKLDGTLQNARLDDIQAFREIRCPKVAIGIGLNALLPQPSPKVGRLQPTRDAANRLAQLTETLNLVSTRCELTQRTLAEVSGRTVRMVGDPALLRATCLKARTGPPMSRHVGVNFALHGNVSAQLFGQTIHIYLPFLKQLLAERHVLVYFMHCDTEEIAVEILRANGIRCEVVRQPLEPMLERYQMMEIVISQMLHSAILATSVGTPSINVAYDVKSLSFYKQLQLGRYCCDIHSVSCDWLSAAFADAMEHHDAIRATIEDWTGRARLAMRDFLMEVEELVAGTVHLNTEH